MCPTRNDQRVGCTSEAHRLVDEDLHGEVHQRLLQKDSSGRSCKGQHRVSPSPTAAVKRTVSAP